MQDGSRRAGDVLILARDSIVGDARVAKLRFSGGFSEVYEAFVGDRRVALKRLRPEAIAVASAPERLRLEADALGALHHPNIVEVLACGEHAGWPYLILEWLEGATLAETVRGGALSPVATLAILDQLCDALVAAHALGIVHRDIKADNVIVVDAERLQVKLVDFGIAKLLRDGDRGLTTTTQLIGTPVAMAPEQILGGIVDERTDIYALGILACHLLTGRLPFLAPTIIETQELHLSAEPPRPSRLVAVPQAVDAVIARALAKTPDARHPSVSMFLADLRDALTGTSTPRRGAVLYVELEADGYDDDTLDVIDEVLVDAAAAAREAGLEVLVEAGNAILAAASLPGDGLHLRARAIDAAVTIARPRLRARVRAVVTSLAGSVDDGVPTPHQPGKSGAYATREAIVGIEGLVVEALDDSHVRVTRN
jgi:eukaryotic-like serine/threonine-protein kinase